MTRIAMTLALMTVLGCSTVDTNTSTKSEADATSHNHLRQKKSKPKIEFSVNPKTLVEGDTLMISWDVVDSGKTSKVYLSGARVDQSGRRELVSNAGVYQYELSVETSDTTITNTIQVVVKKKPTVRWTPDDVSQGSDDGRYTIGCRGERLTYGFPAPLSTSHIVLKVNEYYASNNPSFANLADVRLLRGTAVRAGRIGYNRTEIPFRFYGVDVLQRVVPVDKYFKEIDDEQNAVYYKMAWTLTNRHATAVSAGLLYLLDTMIDDNDAARVVADASSVHVETEFTGVNVPSRLFIYRRNTNNNDLTAVFLPNTAASPQPTSVVVGRWPYLHGQTWTRYESGESYYDSAIMTTWDNLTINPNESVTLVAFYGTKQEYPMMMIDNNQNMRNASLALNYDKSETSLSLVDMGKIREFVTGKRILAASVSGFSDAQGDDSRNLSVSEERAQRVAAQLRRYGVDPRLIMVKSYGESQAFQSTEAENNGNEPDRRVELSVWYE